MNPKRLAIFFQVLFFAVALHAQTTYNYILNEANIHVSPTPVPVGGIHPPSDYPSISKPLVAEPFATNSEINTEAGNIYFSAAGVADVFFGGDLPDNEDGAAPVPLFTKQTFNTTDFPILLECDFFSRFANNLYNESYMVILPSNYQYFGSSTYNFALNSDPREGLMIGGRPTLTFINDNFDAASQSLTVQVSEHNISQFESWYNFKTILDLVNGELIVRNARVDDQCVFFSDKNMGPLDWLDDFRLGIAVDDLASNFSITTNYEVAKSEFVLPEKICVGECIDLINESYSDACDDQISFEWLFPGANIENSFDENPVGICYAEAGTYTVTLIVNTINGNLITSKTLEVLSAPTADLGPDTIFCNTDDYLLEVTHVNAINYTWQDGSTDSIYWVSESGNYAVTINSDCGIVEDEVDIQIIAAVFPPNLASDQLVCTGDTLVLDATASNATFYNWQDGSVLPALEVTEAGSYQVQVSNECSEVEFLVEVEKENCCPFYLPNAFSPNEDGFNDRFGALHSFQLCDNIQDFSFQIYDRWGQVIFETTDLNASWDGKIRERRAQPATYVWLLKYNDGLDDHTETGSVILIR